MTSDRRSRSPAAVVLAAGLGTRMRSERPKVAHQVAGRPMIRWVVEAVREAGCREICVVVGHGAEEVREALAAADEGIVWVLQDAQRGTADALARVEPHLTEPEGRLLVVPGDAPLVTPATLRSLLGRAEGVWGALATARLSCPGSLGRVVVGRDGGLERIVEAADATPEELALETVNAGFYVLPTPEIFRRLETLGSDNAKGELYLTDTFGAVVAEGLKVELLELEDPREAQGVNTREELARVHRWLLAAAADRLVASGVTLLDAERTWIEPGVDVGPDTVIHPGVTLSGTTRVGRGCELHAGAWLRDCELGDEVTVEPYSVLDGARVAAGSRVGPFARLRPGAVLEAGVRVGNFVEVKNSRLGPGVKAGHLTYLGDATIGEGANVGAGTVTCNYDGERKHRTTIGKRAFIGSDTMLVAPVEIGDGATTGAGSVIARDVPAGALAVERSEQRTIPNWRRRRRDKE